MKLGKKHKI